MPSSVKGGKDAGSVNSLPVQMIGRLKDAASGVWSDLSSEACDEGNESPTEAA